MKIYKDDKKRFISKGIKGRNSRTAAGMDDAAGRKIPAGLHETERQI